jgi:hypothetical protein
MLSSADKAKIFAGIVFRSGMRMRLKTRQQHLSGAAVRVHVSVYGSLRQE